MSHGKIIMVRNARFVPILLLSAAGGMGFSESGWWFLSIPFILVGWMFAIPNLSLVNGLPAYLAMIMGFVLLMFHQPSGAAVVLGAMAGFYLSAVEMRIMAKSYEPGNSPQAGKNAPANKP